MRVNQKQESKRTIKTMSTGFGCTKPEEAGFFKNKISIFKIFFKIKEGIERKMNKKLLKLTKQIKKVI